MRVKINRGEGSKFLNLELVADTMMDKHIIEILGREILQPDSTSSFSHEQREEWKIVLTLPTRIHPSSKKIIESLSAN